MDVRAIKLLIGGLGFAMATALLTPATHGQSETIKIVSSMPRTGLAKGQTDSIVNSIRLALDEVGYQVGEYVVAYEDLDDTTPTKPSWDAGQEAANARQAVGDPDVMAYIGTFNSGAAKVAIPILNRAGLVMVSPANTYPGLTKPGTGYPNEPDVYYPSGVRNYARVTPADDLQGVVAAAWASHLGAHRVYVLDDTELYGHTIALEFSKRARELGIEVIGPEGFDPKAADYLGLAAKVKATAPDLVYYGGITQNNAGRLFKDLRAALGPDVRLMAPDGVYEQQFLDDAGEAAESVYVTFGGVAPSKLLGRGADWYAAYKAKYRQEPEAYAGYGYEATQVILDAIRRAGTKDREAIRAALMATADYDGILGTWSFDANGDTTLTTMSGRLVRGGRFDDRNAITLTVDGPLETPTPSEPVVSGT